MKLKAINYLAILSLLLVGCTSGNEDATEVDINLGKTRYTFSQSEVVDFSVSSGGYQILYDYSVPIDTLFDYSGAHLIGKDSIVYLQLRRVLTIDEPFPGEYSEAYHGDLIGLKLYDGKKIVSFELPHFDPMFSSFSVHEGILYYWGCSNELYACSYNFQNKKFNKMRLQNGSVGTDFFGAFDPPTFNEVGNVIFRCDGAGRIWTLTPTLSNIINIRDLTH